MIRIEDLEDIKKTDTWLLFEKGRNYLRKNHVYTDTDRNYRMYSGNQWEGAKIEGIEQAQYNFIETIVNYKVSTINQNLYAMHFSSENFEQEAFRKNAKKVCELLDKKAAKVWEKDQMDTKVREVTEDAAINDEGVLYVYFDKNNNEPVNEILNKNDVQFGNEQCSDIQLQPYVIIAQRKPLVDVLAMCDAENVSEENKQLIVCDNDNYDQAGENARLEKDDMCTLVTKMWKENGTVHYQMATKYVDLKKDTDAKISLYPVSHMLWKEKKGWSRGEGEVRTLIPNQLELNKSLARMLLSIKQNAYPTKVVNTDKILNPSSINQIGGIVKTKGGATVDDVNKIFSIIAPAQMSTDVSKVMSDLISITRELKNASDIATGGVNPEDASGKAILAVQQASQQPMTKQSLSLKKFVEDIARIWLEMWTVYTPNGMELEEEQILDDGTETTKLVKVPASVLENLKASVKIDITPTSPYDKYARELSIENMFRAGMFNVQKLPELKIYAKLLPDNSAMPKQEILEAVEMMEAEQQKIAIMDSQAQLMQARASQFINTDDSTQANMILNAEQQPTEEEAS